MIKLHCRRVFWMSFWYLGRKRKFLAARNVRAFLEYASDFTITIFLPLSALNDYFIFCYNFFI